MFAALDRLCELAEFRDQGLTVVDTFEGDEQRVAFRTVVQLGGELLVLVDPELLEHPRFGELHQAHAEHVRARLSEVVTRLRRWLRGVTWIGVGGVALLTGSLSASLGLSELLIGEVEHALHVGLAAVLGGVAWPLGGKLLGVFVRRRLGEQSRLDQLISRKSR